ncbi:Lysine exporter protein (LYSE/YGGA) [Methanoregula boonei 6A8]|uniref:Lysine exporter protein (LYSE/YGGA) n=1 Tax=Methanoregula boonei (strain DSM 21154 / JCM 14090 / 6A8) TaxID=456442 RepID=A7I5X3_METB6|nr:LysE family transporter [Methanoregula boonei]ABS55134.1 Lysine exporter protein (LYSE/YGGA) [Methanoregula boonei 6A8]
METGAFINGIIIGIALAAPVGPIAFVCIQRSLAYGRLHGIASGLGIATADTIYAAVTAFGLALISDFLLARQWFFRLFGGLALIVVGIKIFLAGPPEISPAPESESFITDYSTMLAITLANPLTIVFFTIIIPGFGVVLSGTTGVTPALFVTGVFLGEIGWWIFLCGTLGSMREYLTRERLHLINRLAGFVIAAFGGVMIASLFITSDIL